MGSRSEMRMDQVAGSGNDEFYTPKYAVDAIAKHIPPYSKIWCPFDTNKSLFVKVLVSMGHTVINTHLDELYYVRANNNTPNLVSANFYFRSPEFSTSHDIILAQLKGFDRLANYLQNRLYNLKNPKSLNTLDIHKKSRLRWTSSRVALTELIYALHSTDVINNGTVDIKDIAYFVEKTFKVDLGDYYRAFLEIRMRKNGRTKFLDILKKQLTKRMDDSDNIK